MRDLVGAGADMAGMISTEYLERCLQKCSLNKVVEGGGGGDFSSSSSAESPGNDIIIDDQSSSVGEETTLDLNSHISLPLHWERCLDLKTGEIYYINWRTGKKVWEEQANSSTNLYYSPPSSYDSCSEEYSNSTSGVSSLSPSSSSTSSSCFSSRDHQCYDGGEGEYRKKKKKKKNGKKMSRRNRKNMDMGEEEEEEKQLQQVLVVAGCRNCFMYFMVPRLVQDCPKCFSQLLHFDDLAASSSSSSSSSSSPS